MQSFLAAAAAKSLQSCPTLRPHRPQPTRLRGPWDSPGKNAGGGCHFLLQFMKVKSESEIAQSCPTLSDPTAAFQVPPSMGFSRQEYWSGVPLPSPYNPWYELKINQTNQPTKKKTSKLIILNWITNGNLFCLGPLELVPRKWLYGKLAI